MTDEQKKLLQLRSFANTPDVMLQRDNTGENAINSALNSSAKAAAEQQGVEPPQPEQIQEQTPQPDTYAQQTQNAPGIGQQIPGAATATGYNNANPAAMYGNAMKPAKMINFKLKELFDPELIVMILDMLLSWGGSALLQANGIDVESEQLQADDFQKNILLKAFNPMFDTYEVGTNNPIIGVTLAIAAVYSKNVVNCIKENKRKVNAQKENGTYVEPKKRRAKYTTKKRESKPRANKTFAFTPTTSQSNQNYF